MQWLVGIELEKLSDIHPKIHLSANVLNFVSFVLFYRMSFYNDVHKIRSPVFDFVS